MKNLLLTFCLFGASLLTNYAQSDRSMKTVAGGSGKRTALVIGNAAYRSAAPLKNPLNDANAMSTALRELGFEVVKHLNTDRQSMEQVINDWGKTLSGYDVALFFYAGHGAEVNGTNFLFPTDANPQNASQAKFQACPVELVTGWMDEARVKTNILLLDACRDNPFSRSWSRSSANGGLANMNAPSGTFIGFATQPGRTAADGDRTNGVYTEAILQAIKTPNKTIDQIFNDVNAYVRQASGGVQVPFKNSSLDADFYFVGNTVMSAVTTEPKAEPKREEPAKPAVDLEPVAMRYVAGGSFEMGSNGDDREKPIHRVTVSPFRMATYETTVAEFERFVEATGYQTEAEKGDGSHVWNASASKFEKQAGINWRYGAEGTIQSNKQHPVIHVSWNDSVAYCDWLTRKTGKTYRLPTEAEWEYAAGNGSTHNKYSWGNDEPGSRGVGNIADSKAESRFNISWALATYDDGYAATSPVGTYAANVYGLHDMSGNVWEWCSDWYGAYSSETQTNPTGVATGSARVIRGGSWNSFPANGRVASRSFSAPSNRSYTFGFRVVSLQ